MPTTGTGGGVVVPLPSLGRSTQMSEGCSETGPEGRQSQRVLGWKEAGSQKRTDVRGRSPRSSWMTCHPASTGINGQDRKMGAFEPFDFKESSDEARLCVCSAACEKGARCTVSWELSFPGRRCDLGFLLRTAEGNLIT